MTGRSLALAALLVAGCATTPRPEAVAPPVPPGLAAVLEKGVDVAVQLLGPSALDRREGEARHLQFAGAGCVLDLFYYPPAAGQVPVATHAAARRPDGSAIAPGDCLRLLESARGSAR